MKLSILLISAMFLVGLSACSTTSAEDDSDLYVGQIEEIDFECGGWGLRTTDTFYELVNLPEDYQTDGLNVRIMAKERDDLVSCNMAGPIIEVIQVSVRF